MIGPPVGEGPGRPAKKAGTAKKVAPAKKTGGAKKVVAVKKTVVGKKVGGKKVGAKKVVARKVLGPRKAEGAKKAGAVKKAVGARKAVASKKAGGVRKSAVAPSAPVEAPPPPAEPAPPPPPPGWPPPPTWPPPGSPPPGWPPPGWPPPAPSGPPREGLAVAALITGIVSVPLVVTVVGSTLVAFATIVVGITALVRIRAHPERSGRGMAYGGLALAAVSILLTVLVVASFDDDDDPNELGTVAYLSLEAGDCYQREFEFELGNRVALRECAVEHDREVVGVLDVPDPRGAPYPGPGALNLRAEDLCRPLFVDYVGPPADPSKLALRTLRPTRGAWRQGNRRIVCSVERTNQAPLRGSVRGKGGNP